jgi:hypothetical protein
LVLLIIVTNTTVRPQICSQFPLDWFCPKQSTGPLV